MVTVVSIVLILSLIAMPWVVGVKTRAHNAHALRALEDLARAQMSRFAAEGHYASCDSPISCAAEFPEIGPTPDLTLWAEADANGFVATAADPKGDTEYFWDSANGGLQGASGGNSTNGGGST